MSSETETMMLAKARQEYGIAELSNEAFLGTIKERVATFPPATEKEGYEIRRSTIAEIRKIRGVIETRRKELKADSLAYGRRIDAFAKHWTEQLMSIEEPLKLEKEAVDQAKEDERKAREEKIRKAQEEEARQRLLAEEERLRAERLAEEERLKVQRQADEERIRKENEARQAEIDAERARLKEAADRIRKIEDEQRAEKARLDAQAKELEQQRLRAEQAEQERLAELRRVQDEEQRKKDAAAAELQRKERAERLKPDMVKLREYADMLIAMPTPTVKSQEAKETLAVVAEMMQRLIYRLTNV